MAPNSKVVVVNFVVVLEVGEEPGPSISSVLPAASVDEVGWAIDLT
jgi:hypothetical protein